MELDGFIRILNEVSEGNFVIKDAESIFKSISKNGKMTFEQFNKNFKIASVSFFTTVKPSRWGEYCA